MSEDAPVNSGAVKWPHPDSAYFTVRSMQIKLHRWAGEILPAGSVTCSTSSTTRRSWCMRGSACPGTRGRGHRVSIRPRWP